MTCHCDLGHMRGKACHCRACCLTFSSPSAFDHHIIRGAHMPPGDRGLVQVRAGVWGRPGSETRRLPGRVLDAPRKETR